MKTSASGGHELVPIDHGYVLPDSFQDISFEWLYWPQARAPLGEYLRSSMVVKEMHALRSSELLWLIQACAESDREHLAPALPLVMLAHHALTYCAWPSMRRMLSLVGCMQMRLRGRT